MRGRQVDPGACLSHPRQEVQAGETQEKFPVHETRWRPGRQAGRQENVRKE